MVRAGHAVQCLGAPLAHTAVTGLIFDGVLFSRRSHRHCAHSACGQGEGNGIVGREVAFTHS